MLSHEKICLKILFERCPVATNDAVMGNHWLKDATIVVSLVLVIWQQDNIATLITNQVFVVGWNQEVFALAETTGATIVGQIEFPMW